MEYKLKILSPLHIGGGEKYDGLNYLLDKRKKPEKVYVVADDVISEAFGQEKMEEFKSWREKEKYPNLFKYLKYEIKDENFALHNELQNKARYSLINLSGADKLREIYSFHKDTDKVYIPEKEIKKSMKQAFTYYLINEDKNFYDNLKKQIENYIERHRYLLGLIKETSNMNKKLEEIVEIPEEIPEELAKYKDWKVNKIKNEINKGLHKLVKMIVNELLQNKYKEKGEFIETLSIGNSEIKTPESVLCISSVKITGKKNQFNKYYEFLKSGTILALKEFKPEEEKSDESTEESTEEQKNPLTVEEIFKYCYQFNKDLLEEEIDYFKENENNNIIEHLNSIASQNTEETPVIYLGLDERELEPALTLTIKRKNPELYEELLMSAGKNLKHSGKNLMPKSRKIVHYNDQDITAGWVQILNKEIKKEKTKRKKDTRGKTKKKQKPSPLDNKLTELAKIWNG